MPERFRDHPRYEGSLHFRRNENAGTQWGGPGVPTSFVGPPAFFGAIALAARKAGHEARPTRLGASDFHFHVARPTFPGAEPRYKRLPKSAADLVE
jgi:hypothetical protein